MFHAVKRAGTIFEQGGQGQKSSFSMQGVYPLKAMTQAFPPLFLPLPFTLIPPLLYPPFPISPLPLFPLEVGPLKSS